MAHKAGLVAAGFAKTEAALTRDRVAALINASRPPRTVLGNSLPRCTGGKTGRKFLLSMGFHPHNWIWLSGGQM